jgi:molecular chaperone GrpE
VVDAEVVDEEPSRREEVMAEENTSPEEQAEASGEQETAPDAEADALDQELADLVEDTGPISKEAELLADLQRLQAEFVNYKSRVERDRDQSRNAAVAEVLRTLLPALDDLERAESHGDLEGSPFAAVVTKLRGAGERFGLKRFGAAGDKFNPELHNALVQTPNAEVKEAVINEVIEAGYEIEDRLLRPAMVSVFVPEES